ncbi:hypothetical protein AJ79_07385 [Helicocarpus griseus UAMH5409]|uniref:Uncharacterized protein n=1 Tax=Helicocarpus griseus UAMH5409 TaxID=1447875 RepID=A0A2B7X3G1_9EURO|nr:hypothetical protein AJ79_07385 [Helicocarpus griseus UAMH5409]
MVANDGFMGGQRPPVPPQHLPPQHMPQGQMVPAHSGQPPRPLDPNQMAGLLINTHQQVDAMAKQLKKLNLDPSAMHRLHEGTNRDSSGKAVRAYPDNVPILYEGWTLHQETSLQEYWSSVTRKRMDLSQEELAKMATSPQERSVWGTYAAFGKRKQAVIDQLVDYRKKNDGDDRFEWSYVYINPIKKNVAYNRYITAYLEIVLKRQVLPGITLPSRGSDTKTRDPTDNVHMKGKNQGFSFPSDMHAQRLPEPIFGRQNFQHFGGTAANDQRHNAAPAIVNPGMGMGAPPAGEQHGGFFLPQGGQPRMPAQVQQIQQAPPNVQIVHEPEPERHTLPPPPPHPPLHFDNRTEREQPAYPHPQQYSHPQQPHPQQQLQQHAQQHAQQHPQSRPQPQPQSPRQLNMDYAHQKQRQMQQPVSPKIINTRKMPPRDAFGIEYRDADSSVDDDESLLFEGDDYEDTGSAITDDSLFLDEHDKFLDPSDAIGRIQRRASNGRGRKEHPYRYHQRPMKSYLGYNEHRRPQSRYPSELGVDLYPANSLHKRRPDRLSRSASLSYPAVRPQGKLTYDSRREHIAPLSPNRAPRAPSPTKYRNAHVRGDFGRDRDKDWERDQQEREQNVSSYIDRHQQKQENSRRHWKQSVEIHGPPPQFREAADHHPPQLPREDRFDKYDRMAQLNQMAGGGGAGGRRPQDKFEDDDAFNDTNPFGSDRMDHSPMGHGRQERERMDDRRRPQMEERRGGYGVYGQGIRPMRM